MGEASPLYENLTGTSHKGEHVSSEGTYFRWPFMGYVLPELGYRAIVVVGGSGSSRC